MCLEAVLCNRYVLQDLRGNMHSVATPAKPTIAVVAIATANPAPRQE